MPYRNVPVSAIYTSPFIDRNFLGGEGTGLAATVATNTGGSSASDYSPEAMRDWSASQNPSARVKNLKNDDNQTTNEYIGMNPKVAGAIGIGQLGLSIAGFLDGKKTAKLQREGMKLNLDEARAAATRREEQNKAWADAWAAQAQN